MNKTPQHYKNHRQFVPLYHILTFAAMLFLLYGGIYMVATAQPGQTFPAILFIVIALTLLSVSLHNRSFALKAQDRAIRAEENLRYFILTGKRLNQSISLNQIIALRFADDNEFAELVDRTIKENLTPKQIKQSVKNWRADHHRA